MSKVQSIVKKMQKHGQKQKDRKITPSALTQDEFSHISRCLLSLCEQHPGTAISTDIRKLVKDALFWRVIAGGLKKTIGRCEHDSMLKALPESLVDPKECFDEELSRKISAEGGRPGGN